MSVTFMSFSNVLLAGAASHCPAVILFVIPRHFGFGDQLPDLVHDQKQKRRRLSEEQSMFASLDSSLCASELQDQNSSITELEDERHPSIELATSQDSRMPDTTWDEREQQKLALLSSDVPSEVQQIDPCDGTKTHSIYKSAFKQHLSDSSQRSQYWSHSKSINAAVPVLSVCLLSLQQHRNLEFGRDCQDPSLNLIEDLKVQLAVLTTDKVHYFITLRLLTRTVNK